jgi:hypothetical protein
MTISDTTENAILNLVFRTVNWANYADNAASTPETIIAVALHSADPGDAGVQNTSELSGGSYARVNVNRNTGAWSAAAGGSISPIASIDFPAMSAGGGTASFFSTGKSGGAGSAILWSGAVAPVIVTANGVTPRLTTASTITLD